MEPAVLEVMKDRHLMLGVSQELSEPSPKGDGLKQRAVTWLKTRIVITFGAPDDAGDFNPERMYGQTGSARRHGRFSFKRLQ